MSIYDSGSCEPFKATVHGVTAALMVVCGVYNVVACCRRPARHLAFNALAYAMLAVWEVEHVVCHYKETEPNGNDRATRGSVLQGPLEGA